MRIIDEDKGLPCKELTDPCVFSSPLAKAILELIVQEEGMHGSAIAKRLGQPQQKIHYHLRKLRDAGVLAIDHVQEGQGAAAKVLRATAPAFFTAFKQMETIPGRGARRDDTLDPLIVNGRWNAKIVIGSPDPHGPEAARGRDASYVAELALFLGLFLDVRAEDAVMLDTELRDWNHNLIVIGGPVVNKAARTLNEYSPVRYEDKAFRYDGKAYDQDTVGIIARLRNPIAPARSVLWLAGKRHAGTKAAVLAFTKSFEDIKNAEIAIVKGYDSNSDGTIDTAEILTK